LRYSIPYLADAEPQVVVEGGGGEQHLREAGGGAHGAGEVEALAGVGQPVERLVPPLVRGHAQPRHAGRHVAELRHLLRRRHPGHQVRGASLASQNAYPWVASADDGPHENGGELPVARGSNAAMTVVIKRSGAAMPLALMLCLLLL
jgi:hypothetical protein